MRLAVSAEPTEATLTFGHQIDATEVVDASCLAVERGHSRQQDSLLLRNRGQYV